MTYVVTESCIKCKYTDCVEICPVDCFYEGPEFLVIDPDECIDCGLCEPECPIEAIYADDDLPSDQIEFIEINLKLSEVYENITEAKEPLPEAEKYKDINWEILSEENVKDKIRNTISENAQPKNIKQVGLRLMKFCALYDMQRITDNAQAYAEPLQARYPV